MPRVANTSNITNPKRYGYDIQLDNIFLRTAVGPNRDMTIQSSDVQEGQINVKQNPEDFTSNLGRIYSRNKFNAGQGLDTAHRTDGKPDDVNRFWDSKGIDVFNGDDETSYHIHLLYTTAAKEINFSGTNNFITRTTNGNLEFGDLSINAGPTIDTTGGGSTSNNVTSDETVIENGRLLVYSITRDPNGNVVSRTFLRDLGPSGGSGSGGGGEVAPVPGDPVEKFNVKEFARKFNKGNYIVAVNKHALAICDGVIVDNGNYQADGYRRVVESAFRIS